MLWGGWFNDEDTDVGSDQDGDEDVQERSGRDRRMGQDPLLGTRRRSGGLCRPKTRRAQMPPGHFQRKRIESPSRQMARRSLSVASKDFLPSCRPKYDPWNIHMRVAGFRPIVRVQGSRCATYIDLRKMTATGPLPPDLMIPKRSSPGLKEPVRRLCWARSVAV
jgi:hypothetical protein